MYRLSGSDLLPLVRNALRTELDEQNRVRFFRFTPKQMEEYGKESVFAIRSLLTNGVTLDFVTDSLHLELAWELVQRGPWDVSDVVDLYLDGVLVQSQALPNEPDSATRLTFSLPEGKKRVTFWFPRTFVIALTELILSDGASVELLPARKNYLALGDSITFSSAQHPSLSYCAQVASHFGWELYNQGIGGYVFCADSLDSNFPWKPDVITVAYGTNDNRSDRDAYRIRVRTYLERLCAIWPDIPIFLITPLWRLDISGTEPFDWIYPVIEEECARHPQISVIDGRTAMPRLPEFYSDAYLHPNNLGMTFYAQSIVRTMEQAGL